MCYVAAFEKRGGREPRLACDFGVFTLVPRSSSHVCCTPLQERNRPLLVDHILVGGKRHGSGCAPGSGSLAGLPCFLCIPARRYSGQQAACRSLFSGVPGSTTSRLVPASVPASTRSLYVFCCCCLSPCRCWFCCLFGVFAKPTSHGIRLTHLFGVMVIHYCAVHPFQCRASCSVFHYFACVQVMSMVPDTNLDAKCFEDAPVPVEEREFQING